MRPTWDEKFKAASIHHLARIYVELKYVYA